MRAIVMLLILSIAGTCFAEDPLETLNTVEDTVNTMEQTLKAQGAPEQVLYFVSGEKIGASDWVAANPCPEGVVPMGKDAGLCLQGGASDSGQHFWKSRIAVPTDLRPGMVILTQDEATNGSWVMAKVTDVSEVATGFVGTTAPFKTATRGLRVVVE